MNPASKDSVAKYDNPALLSQSLHLPVFRANSQRWQGRPPAPEKSKKHSAEVDTALHVIKGAIVTVLGPTAVLTTSVGFESPSKYVRWECRSSSCLCAELE